MQNYMPSIIFCSPKLSQFQKKIEGVELNTLMYIIWKKKLNILFNAVM